MALADPGAGDEPGVDADWEKITDQVAANPGGTPALTLSTMTIGMFDYTVSGGGTGATTFVALTDTPSSITADMCVLGNGAGNALIFGACGGAGDGDIEGVTAGIGLSGGGTTGTVTLNLDLTSGVGAVTDLQDGDDFVLADASNSDGTRRATFSVLSSEVRDEIVAADIPSTFATDAEVDGVFDAASFSNVTRDLVFGHYGTGTSAIPLDFLN